MDAYCFVLILRANVKFSVLLTDGLLEQKCTIKSNLRGNKTFTKESKQKVKITQMVKEVL